MKVIGFCGLPGSGKSTAINALKDLGIIINMGDIIRSEAKNRKIEPSDENLGKIAKELREKQGKGIIAQKCVELIKNLKAEVIFVDGIRSLNEVEVFRKHWKFPVIEIATKNEIRHKRISDRARTDDSITISSMIERDKREIELGIKEVLLRADYKISNNSTVDELNKKTRKIILKILENY